MHKEVIAVGFFRIYIFSFFINFVVFQFPDSSVSFSIDLAPKESSLFTAPIIWGVAAVSEIIQSDGTRDERMEFQLLSLFR